MHLHIRFGNYPRAAHYQHQRKGSHDKRAVFMQWIGRINRGSQTTAGTVVIRCRLRAAHGAASTARTTASASLRALPCLLEGPSTRDPEAEVLTRLDIGSHHDGCAR